MEEMVLQGLVLYCIYGQISDFSGLKSAIFRTKIYRSFWGPLLPPSAGWRDREMQLTLDFETNTTIQLSFLKVTLVRLGR
jgi:hypothetical protein